MYTSGILVLQPMESFRCCDNLSKIILRRAKSWPKTCISTSLQQRRRYFNQKPTIVRAACSLVIRAARRVCTDVTLSPYKLYQSSFFVCVGWVLSRNLTPGDTSKNIIGRKRFGFSRPSLLQAAQYEKGVSGPPCARNERIV